MGQMAFLDTNIILDYLENRNGDVRDVIANLLLLHKKGKLLLGTSVFNIAELIDKEFEIHFIGWCLGRRMTYEEIQSNKRKDIFKNICDQNKDPIEKKVSNFIFGNNIEILSLQVDKQYNEIFNLIYQRNLRSQDALIVATAVSNNVTYFLSNDTDLTNHVSDLISTFNLGDSKQLQTFRDNVVQAV